MKKLMILAASAAMLLSGCVATVGSYKPPATPAEKPTVRLYRVAILYPFAVEDVQLPDGTKIGKWNSTGGAAELVPLMDAGGKILGYVAKGAVAGVK